MEIIVLQHIKVEDPGYIKDLMLSDGLNLTTIELDEGEKIPDDLSKFDGMFCMGGPMDTWMEKKYPWLINKNIIPKKELYNLIYHSKCLCVPLKFGSGTRIKIIEALSIGAIVISSLKGIEGIELNKKNPPFVLKNNKKFINTIDNVIKNNKAIKKKSIIAKNFYLKKYSMRKITNNFLKNCL